MTARRCCRLGRTFRESKAFARSITPPWLRFPRRHDLRWADQAALAAQPCIRAPRARSVYLNIAVLGGPETSLGTTVDLRGHATAGLSCCVSRYALEIATEGDMPAIARRLIQTILVACNHLGSDYIRKLPYWIRYVFKS